MKGTTMLSALGRRFVAVSMLSPLALLFVAGTVFAQTQGNGENDLLDQARRMDRVAALKLEADLRGALHESERLARSNRAKALDCLKKALALLDDDTVLSSDRRESLKRMLQDRIRVVESETDGAPSSATDTDKKPI